MQTSMMKTFEFLWHMSGSHHWNWSNDFLGVIFCYLVKPHVQQISRWFAKLQCASDFAYRSAGTQAVFWVTCRALPPLLGIKLFNATKRSSMIRLNRIPTNGLHTVFQRINELVVQHTNLLILLSSKGRHKTCKINAAGLQEACQLCNIQGKLAGTLAQKKATPHLA